MNIQIPAQAVISHWSTVVYLLILSISINCGNKQGEQNALNTKSIATHAAVYFEIPVTDMDRSMRFYRQVFGFDFVRDSIDGNDMALLPVDSTGKGISGALAKGEAYRPTHQGIILYFSTDNVRETMRKAMEAGGKELYPVTDNGPLGWVAEFEDSEGNRIALHQRRN